MEDSDIIRLYHRRNEEAIAETDRKHGPFCRRLAGNILSSREDVEECVNDVWLAAWNGMPPDWPRSLPAWLGRITRNLCISRYRKNRAAMRDSGLEVLLSELEDCLPGEDMERELERRELARLISSWLDGLNEEDRTLFLRRYWYGDAVKDLAAICGTTENRMARRMQRLRKSLRKVLEQEGAIV